MSARQIDLKNVPAIEVINARLLAIDPILTIDRVGYDFDAMTYTLVLMGHGREGRAVFPRELLDDVRDNKTPPGSRYAQELLAKLTDGLRETVESNGLISFDEKALEYKLLQFIEKEGKTQLHVEKYNTIGRDAEGDFERWLRTTLTNEEKKTLNWLWDDLVRRRLIAPTGKDLVIPDGWVRTTDRGAKAIEGKSYLDYVAAEKPDFNYTSTELFIPPGGVYTAYRAIKNIMTQARKEIFVVDPYVNEDLLDMFASLHDTINIRVLTEHLKGDFKLAFRKLRQQRGGIEARTSSKFHDRFVFIDGQACYQLGGSINHAGAKATTIGKRSDAMRDSILTEAEKTWLSASPVL